VPFRLSSNCSIRAAAGGDGAISLILNYRPEWLRSDVIAGLTAAAVVIPMAMACATIAGLPVQVGLYAAVVPMLIYALLGTSWPLTAHRPSACQ
jgi:MFS superfamily sulfate permease-like transporter